MLDYLVDEFTACGWVLLPIYLTSVMGLFIIIGGIWRLRRQGKPFSGWQRSFRYPRMAERWLEGSDLKQTQRSIPGRVMAAIWEKRAYGRLAMLEAMDEQMKYARPELEKGKATLGILAAVAPLLGLLGTVEGMSETFVVISLFGTGNAALMSDGIAEALLTTQNGLLAAIPLMIGYIFLSAQSLTIETETEKAAHRLINYLQLQRR